MMRKSITIYALTIGLIWSVAPAASGQQSGPVKSAPPTTVEPPQTSTRTSSESDVATASKPIAPMDAIFFQNFYAPTIYGLPGPSNLLDVREVVVSGRQIVRATLPISSAEGSNGNQQSGLGDFNAFDAIRVTPEESKNVLAVGPLLVAPSAESFLRTRQMASRIRRGRPSFAVGGERSDRRPNLAALLCRRARSP